MKHIQKLKNTNIDKLNQRVKEEKERLITVMQLINMLYSNKYVYLLY